MSTIAIPRRYGASTAPRGAFARRERGFALIEALIAMLILMIGLLGLMGVQVRSEVAQTEAYHRQQALLVLQDMVDRINANHTTAACYVTATATGNPYLGTGATGTVGCSGYGDVNTQARVVSDLTEWNGLLLGEHETLSGSSVGGLLGARGCVIAKDAANRIYTVTVVWQGLKATAAPGDTCAQGLYGDEALRRAVSADVQVASLTAP